MPHQRSSHDLRPAAPSSAILECHSPVPFQDDGDSGHARRDTKTVTTHRASWVLSDEVAPRGVRWMGRATPLLCECWYRPFLLYPDTVRADDENSYTSTLQQAVS